MIDLSLNRKNERHSPRPETAWTFQWKTRPLDSLDTLQKIRGLKAWLFVGPNREPLGRKILKANNSWMFHRKSSRKIGVFQQTNPAGSSGIFPPKLTQSMGIFQQTDLTEEGAWIYKSILQPTNGTRVLEIALQMGSSNKSINEIAHPAKWRKDGK